MKCDKKKCLLALVFLSSLLMSLKVYSNEPETNWKYVELVNPFVDSHRSRWFFFSSACRPFGMVSLSPDTDTEHSWGSGYMYGSKYIRCFSHIHNWQMSGVAVMPTVGPFKGHLGMDSYQSEFTHEGEIAKPGFHKVKLTNYDVTAELRAFFSGSDVPKHLLRYKDLFVYQQLQQEVHLGEDFDARVLAEVEVPVVKAKRLTLAARFMPLFKAAAVVAVVLSLGNVMQHSFFSDVEEVAATDTIGKQISAPSVALSGDVPVSHEKQVMDSLRRVNKELEIKE